MVARHRMGAEVDAEVGGRGFHLGDQPLVAVFVVLAGEGVDAAQVGATHAAGDAVVVDTVMYVNRVGGSVRRNLSGFSQPRSRYGRAYASQRRGQPFLPYHC